jgi:NAD(P) transhydrogenase subunit alpha
VGAEVLPTAAALWAGADIIFKVRPPTQEEGSLDARRPDLIDFIWPAQNPDLMQQLEAGK